MDQRSRDGKFDGFSEAFVFYSGNHFFLPFLSRSTRELHQRRTKISIIPTSRRVSLEEQNAQKQDRPLRGRQIAHLIHDSFRVTGVNDSFLDYADSFTYALRDDNIQEIDTRRDGILLSMEHFPPDDILESLHKLIRRESEKLKTVLELYNLEIPQQKAKPDYYRLRPMLK